MRFWVRLVGLLAAVYALVAGALSGKKWPSEKTWAVGTLWFWSWVAAGIVALAAAFVEGVLSRRAAERAAQGVRDNDLNVYCRVIAGKIIDHCNPAGLVPTQLAVGVWLTKNDDTFDRKAQFLFAEERPHSGVDWKKGKGVAGWAWAHDKTVQLESLTDRSMMTEAKFAGYSEDKRLGMTVAEWEKVTAYKAVVARALYATAGPSLLGYLVVDYCGPVKPQGTSLGRCIHDAVVDDGEVRKLRGLIEGRLEKKA
jgi:hypothetical protein